MLELKTESSINPYPPHPPLTNLSPSHGGGGVEGGKGVSGCARQKMHILHAGKGFAV